MSAGVTRPSAAARSALLALAAACIALAAYPEVALIPLRSLVSQMTAPERADSIARLFFACAAVLSLLGAVAPTGMLRSLRSMVSAIEAWQPGKFWAVLGVVAFVPRTALLAMPYTPASDAEWYHEVAMSIAAGSGIAFHGEPTAFRSPGYAALLALGYRVWGAGPFVVWAIGMAATAALLYFTHDVARRMYGEATARLATLACAAYPALIVMTGQALSEVVFTAGLAATVSFVLRIDRPSLRHAAALGVCVGLLTLCRSAALGLVAALPAVWWLRSHHSRALASHVCFAAIACGIVLAPWMVRNAVVLDSFTLGTNAGSNLYVGLTKGVFFGGGEPLIDPVTVTPPGPGEVATDDALRAAVWRFITEHPAAALATVPRKFAAMYMLETEAVSSLFQGERHGGDEVRRVLFVLSQLAWCVVFALVVARVASWHRRDAQPVGVQWVGWGLIGYFTAVCLVFHGQDRYRLPVLPLLAIEAAVVIGSLRNRRALAGRPAQ